MADNKSKKGYQDDAKIDSSDPSELAYAAKDLGCGVTPGAVAVAIHVTKSNSREKVYSWLANNWPRIMRSKCA